MATRAARAAAKPLWKLLEQLDAELQHAVLELIGAAGVKNLRLASRAARALANGRVERIKFPARAVASLSTRLHERYPRLQRLELVDGADGALTDSDFADFAVEELGECGSLVHLGLARCKALGSASVAVLRDCCPQLQELDLEGTGAGQQHTCCVVPLSTTRL